MKKNDQIAGSYVYAGAINGVSLDVQIVALAGAAISSRSRGTPVDLTALTNPVEIAITIGDKVGLHTARATTSQARDR